VGGTPIRDSVGMLGAPSLARKKVASHVQARICFNLLQVLKTRTITASMPFSRFLDLPTELRHEVYELHFLEIPRVVNLSFRSQRLSTSQISAPSPSPIELLCVSQIVSREAAPVIYRRAIFECAGAQEFSFFLMSLSGQFRVHVKRVRFTQATLPYQQIEFYMHELQNMHTIERVLSSERPTLLPYIPTELRPTDRILSNTRFLEVCRQEEQFASRFIEKSTRAFELVITCSKTVEAAAVKEEFHFRIERLHYEEEVLDVIQSKARADLGSQHAATFVEGQCQTFDRLLENGVPGSQDLATESSQIGKKEKRELLLLWK
jgi:hypothetical protein